MECLAASRHLQAASTSLPREACPFLRRRSPTATLLEVVSRHRKFQRMKRTRGQTPREKRFCGVIEASRVAMDQSSSTHQMRLGESRALIPTPLARQAHRRSQQITRSHSSRPRRKHQRRLFSASTRARTQRAIPSPSSKTRPKNQRHLPPTSAPPLLRISLRPTHFRFSRRNQLHQPQASALQPNLRKINQRITSLVELHSRQLPARTSVLGLQRHRRNQLVRHLSLVRAQPTRPPAQALLPLNPPRSLRVIYSATSSRRLQQQQNPSHLRNLPVPNQIYSQMPSFQHPLLVTCLETRSLLKAQGTSLENKASNEMRRAQLAPLRLNPSPARLKSQSRSLLLPRIYSQM